MVKPIKRSNAGKSPKRWQDGRQLDTEVMPTLPHVSHVAVLWACWFHGELTAKGGTVFDLTKNQIATRCGLSERQVARILADLEAGGVIATRKDGCNVGGRSLGSERLITFQPYSNEVASD